MRGSVSTGLDAIALKLTLSSKKVIYKDAFLQGIGDGGFVSSHQDTPVPVVVAKRMMVLTNEQAKQK
jgi:hypothetical protein